MLIVANVARTRLSLIVAAVAVAALLSACGGDSGGPTNSGPPPVPFAGLYDLHSISDSLLPFRVPFPQFTPFRVDSGHIKLNADLSYAYNADGLLTQDSTFASATDTGTFTESGSTITFTSKFLHGQTFVAEATDSSLTVFLIGALIADQDPTIRSVFLKER